MSRCSYFSFLAEAEGFEPPWVLPKRFSRPPRYDRFDKPPFIRFFFSAFSLRCNVYAFASSAARKLSLFAAEQLSLSLDQAIIYYFFVKINCFFLKIIVFRIFPFFDCFYRSFVLKYDRKNMPSGYICIYHSISAF